VKTTANEVTLSTPPDKRRADERPSVAALPAANAYLWVFKPSMAREVSRGKLTFFLVASTLLITFVFYGYQIVFTPNVLVDRDPRPLIIKKGATYRDVQTQLANGGFVNDMVSFSFLARLMGYDQAVKPGRYVLQRNMTNIDAIRALKTGKQVPVNITFNNVRYLTELAEKITRNTGLSAEEFLKAANDYAAHNRDGFTPANLLAMFLPNTYEVYFNVSGEELVQRMKYEYDLFWTEARREKANAIGLTPIEVSILASIVQAEVVKKAEAPTIAGLYLNRLRKGMALQADPTLVFAVGDFSLKRVLNEHKQIDSPYNTYKYAGLPPGPINLPGLEFIDAVLNAEKHNYFYMCAKEDFSGFHHFAKTLDEHNRNARRYQRALTIEQQKAKALARKK
jgi:UPF0755 protein